MYSSCKYSLTLSVRVTLHKPPSLAPLPFTSHMSTQPPLPLMSGRLAKIWRLIPRMVACSSSKIITRRSLYVYLTVFLKPRQICLFMRIQTEADFAQIAGAGLNFVRIPLPYWAIETRDNEPFLAKTCWTYVGVSPSNPQRSRHHVDTF